MVTSKVSVYVLNKHGKPLMPCSPRKARALLRDKKAKFVKYAPFTIQLLYGSSGYKQPITLGVDAASKNGGLSATTDKEELFSAEFVLRNDIVDLLSGRRACRRNRRNRKTRYRKCRFLNRVKSKPKGWIAPSIRNKIEVHKRIIQQVCEILPITKIIVESAQFDISKINNPDIKGKEYHEGPQLNFWNVREYVLFRAGHKCQGKKGCKEKILNVHHIETRAIGGDAPNNLITLCKYCHDDYHKGKLKLDIKRGKSFRDAAFMGIMRKYLFNELKELYSNVEETFGYITKNTRISNGIEKSHVGDAFCITGNINSIRTGINFKIRTIRRHNRQIHKLIINKGGTRKMNQSSYITHGFRLFDKVSFDGKECFIYGRRKSGSFNIRKIDGEIIRKNITFRKLCLVDIGHTIIWALAKDR